VGKIRLLIFSTERFFSDWDKEVIAAFLTSGSVSLKRREKI